MSVFTEVQKMSIRHNTFDLSHERKFSAVAGALTPCFLQEVVPNDRFNINTTQLVRMAPMVAPVMHRMSVYVHFFFVPNRILWDGWEDFINGGQSGEEAPLFPVLKNEPSWVEGSLADYLGLPVGQDLSERDISVLPFAGYQRIWYEFYRDQNLIIGPNYDFLGEPIPDGPQGGFEAPRLSLLRQRAWQHDYFTSALPWTQRGPEATIPLGATADLTYKYGNGTDTFVKDVITGAVSGDIQQLGSTNTGSLLKDAPAPQQTVNLDISRSHEVDLSTATASSINDLRRAFRLQEWLELNARGGARYNETIKIHFGISPGDARLQRPEFLGGSSTPIVISEVLQTSSTTTEPTPQGNMSGHGVSMGGKNTTYYTCKEHGYIFGIMSIMPKSAYQQGIPKHFRKFDKFDYFWKSFANIGEQPILNYEVYADSSDDFDNDIFGYTPRYSEYKYVNDSVHGAFRTSLDFWHAGRIFANRPNLNQVFVEMQNPEISRIFAVTNPDSEQFYVQMYHRVKAKRPMPYFGTPTI